MNNKLYTLEELQQSFVEYEKGNKSKLESLIGNVFKTFNKETFHKMFVDEYTSGNFESYEESYSQFKLILLSKFLESLDTTTPLLKSFLKNESERPFIKYLDELELWLATRIDKTEKLDSIKLPTLYVNRLHVIVEVIIKEIIFSKDNLNFDLIKTIKKFPDIVNGESISSLWRFATYACAANIKLNDNQKDFLKKYDTINPSKWILVGEDNSNKIHFEYDSRYERFFRTLNDETILQMYLLGDPSVTPIAYIDISNNIYIKDTQYHFDCFVDWLWKFVHTENAKHMDRNRLISFCIEILQIVSEVSTGTSYSKKTFSLNNPRDAWKKFKSAKTNAKKRFNTSSDIS